MVVNFVDRSTLSSDFSAFFRRSSLAKPFSFVPVTSKRQSVFSCWVHLLNYWAKTVPNNWVQSVMQKSFGRGQPSEQFILFGTKQIAECRNGPCARAPGRNGVQRRKGVVRYHRVSVHRVLQSAAIYIAKLTGNPSFYQLRFGESRLTISRIVSSLQIVHIWLVVRSAISRPSCHTMDTFLRVWNQLETSIWPRKLQFTIYSRTIFFFNTLMQLVLNGLASLKMRR